jgi:hypothetical protein
LRANSTESTLSSIFSVGRPLSTGRIDGPDGGKPHNAGGCTTGLSVCLEFTIEADAFQLGRVLDPSPGISIELERLVPTDSMVVPFVWVTGEDYSAFERGVRSHSAVESLTALNRNGKQGLYRLSLFHDAVFAVEWEEGRSIGLDKSVLE